MRRILVAGNWKMNGSLASNEALLSGILAGLQDGAPADVLVCPPFPYLASTLEQAAGSAIAVGAQTVSERDPGAFTGEVAASMLADIGCSHAIVGHSERRAIYGETSDAVAAKYVAAQASGLIPVLCVGETREERESGQTNTVIDTQLDAVLGLAGIASFADAIIAYEPVWAIGTGLTATPEQAQDVHRHIRSRLEAMDAGLAANIRILYGGSVKGENAAGLFSQPDIDGGLIGGASLKAGDFLAIINAVKEL